MTDYKDITDSEIRIIGADNASTAPVQESVEEKKINEEGPKRNHWKWIASALIILVLLTIVIAVTVFNTNNKRIVVEDVANTAIADSAKVDTQKTETAEPEINVKASITIKEDSINDIPFIILTPEGCKAELKIGQVDTLDHSIYLCAQAADIRSDNGEIVSAYVLKGEPMSRGIAKKGFCAIINGALTIGMAEETPLYERVVEEKGDFFRQYPLVHDGKMQENNPKNKAIRNALCILKGKVCIIHSIGRESLHDFAQALQDYGVTEAISLTGSYATLFAHDSDGNLTNYGKFDNRYKKANYIIFRK